MFNYQKPTVAWMLQLEKLSSQRKAWPFFHLRSQAADRLTAWPGLDSPLRFQAGTFHVYAVPAAARLSWATQVRLRRFVAKVRRRLADKHTKFAKTAGGILAFEMGLGKTYTCLCLIASDPPPTGPLRSRVDCPFTSLAYATHATLVVCPNHLVRQWEEQVRMHSCLRALCVTTKFAHAQLTYEHFLQADIVVVSSQFLTGKYYHELEESFRVLTGGLLAGARNEFIRMQQHADDPMVRTAPLLTHFKWRRLILDEAHEACVTHLTRTNEVIFSSLYMAVDRIAAARRWYVTGTPLASESMTPAMLGFLKIKVSGRVPKRAEYPGLLALVRDAWFCRHTKISIGSENHVPGVTDTSVFLDLTPVERALFWTHSWGAVARPSSTDAGSLRPVREKGQQALLDAQTKLGDIQDELRCVAWQIAAKPAAWHLLDLQERQEAAERRLPNALATVRLFETIEDNYSRGLHCKQCGVRIEGSAAMGRCGHVFCHGEESKQCLAAHLAVTGKCPACELKLGADLIILSPGNVSAELTVHQAREKYGAKMGAVLVKIQQLTSEKSNRIIVFSQHEQTLLLLGDICKRNEIQNFFVRGLIVIFVFCPSVTVIRDLSIGNVHVRNKAIEEFRMASKPTVLLLSLTHAASGTDLCTATHVFLLDPVPGSAAEAEAVESQAIGRAFRQGQMRHVTVVRFIVRDSPEQITNERHATEPLGLLYGVSEASRCFLSSLR